MDNELIHNSYWATFCNMHDLLLQHSPLDIIFIFVTFRVRFYYVTLPYHANGTFQVSFRSASDTIWIRQKCPFMIKLLVYNLYREGNRVSLAQCS